MAARSGVAGNEVREDPRWLGDHRRLEPVDEVAQLGGREVAGLRRYYELGRFTRPFFEVTLASSDEAWLAEAPRHPVFQVHSSGVP